MKIGFIGCGNMAKAIINALISSKFLQAKDIIASDIYIEALKKTGDDLGINITVSNLEVVEKSKYVVLAIKPQFYDNTIKEIKYTVTDETVIITLAPAKTIEYLEKLFDKKNIKIIRTMPNTPIMVLEGVTAVCKNKNVTDEEIEYVEKLFSVCGLVDIVDESLINSFIAVSGSSPAYIFMLIEAMADGAVLSGMARDKAYKFASQAVLGSAKMVLETKEHPAYLKDMVCSPKGTTIEALRVLEENGFRSAIIKAMASCIEKANRM